MKTYLRSILLSIFILAGAMPWASLSAHASEQPAADAPRGNGAPLATIGPNELFQISLTRLKCNNADEDDWWSDGDEPYVILAIIAPDPFAGYTLHVVSTRVYSDMDRNDVREPNLMLMNRHVESSVAIVAQVVEEDGTGRDVVWAAAERFANDAFVRAMADGVRDLNELRRIVRNAMRWGMANAVTHGGDNDDLVGFPAQITVTRSDFDRLRANGTLNKVREVRDDGVRYTLTIQVRRAR